MKKYKKVIKIISLIIICVIIAGGVLIHYSDPYADNAKEIGSSLAINANIERNLAIEDLNYIVNMIRKHHVSAVNGVKDSVQKQYEKEINNLPQNPTTLDVWRAASRILNKLQDGHSKCKLYSHDPSKQLNIEFKKDDTGLYCIFSNDEKKKVSKINGVDEDIIYNTFLEQFSYENKYYAYYNFENYLRFSDKLSWLGIQNNDGINIEYEENGQAKEKHVSFIEDKKTQEPIYIKSQEFKIDENNNIGIFTLNTCNFNDDYKNAVKEFFSQVKEKNIANIAIDLRQNGGGDSMVIGEFLRYLNIEKYNEFGSKVRYGKFVLNRGSKVIVNKKYEDLLFNGKVYVLTSNSTFSSAMMFSVIIGDNNLGKIIGEPSGNKPCSYGDILQYQLPNSKLAFSTTYKYWIRPDTSKEDEEAQVPDYKVESSKAIEKLYEIIKGKA